MKIKMLAASLVLVFVLTAALSLGFTQTASADYFQCNCVLAYCIDPPGQIYLKGKLHPGERPECQPNPEYCQPGSCN